MRSSRGIRRRSTALAITVAAALVAASCSGDDGTDTTTSSAPPTTAASTTTTEPPVEPLSDDELAAIAAAVDGAPAGCDPLDTRHCLLPFPSDAYTVADDSSRTGRRVAMPADGMPANVSGVRIDPSEWNRSDGFSPNAPMLVHLPGLDADASNLPSWTDLGASLDADATVVLVDLDTAERIAVWAEPEAKAETDDESLLMIYTAVPLMESGHYAVGLRGLIGADGAPLAPSPVFRALRDGLDTGIAAIDDRRPTMDTALDALARASVDTGELQLAWDFTVASEEGIAARVLHARDETLSQLGNGDWSFTANIVEDTPDGLARMIEGTYTVTNWLTGDGAPGNRYFYGDGVTPTADELPQPNGTLEAPFWCIVSNATVDGDEPARLVQYGHGLLGSGREIRAGNVRNFANEHNVVFCATKWAGMAEDDIPNAIASLQDISNFPTMADRLQQGLVNQMVLTRLMGDPTGLASHPAFQREDGTPLIDTSSPVQYDGNSQGGIMGLALAALSPDIERAVLGVPGMNYSLLLPRSVDFDTYEAVFVPSYSSSLERMLIIDLIQMLWDRGEGAGYVQHVTSDPYPGTKAKRLLLHVGFGDWQVTEISAMVMARSIGASIHRPVTAEGRSGEVAPGWNLPDLAYPDNSGSAIIIWDSGSDPIPFAAIPPRTSRDSHEDPRADAEVRRQKASFLFDGTIIDVCGDGPCTVAPRD
jgi:hypothetical protein